MSEDSNIAKQPQKAKKPRMNPLKRIHYNAPFTLTFALAALAVLGLAKLTNNASNVRLFSVYRAPLTDPLTYVRFFGHVLGHADLQHYTSNFLILLMVGPLLEEKYGSGPLAVMTAITALITGVIFVVITGGSALMGASGVVFMLILLSSFANIQAGRIPLTLVAAFAVYIGQEIFRGITSSDNVSQLAHIVGGACGVVCGFYATKLVRRKPRA